MKKVLLLLIVGAFLLGAGLLLERNLTGKPMPSLRIVIQWPSEGGAAGALTPEEATGIPAGEPPVAATSQPVDTNPGGQTRSVPAAGTPILSQAAEIVVSTKSTLAASPLHADSLLELTLPEQSKARVLATDHNGAWLLVLYQGYLGWIPLFHSATGIASLDLAALAPSLSPSCTTYADAILDADQVWHASIGGRVAGESYVYLPTGDPGAEPSLTVNFVETDRVTIANAEQVTLSPTGQLLRFEFSLEGVQLGNQIELELSGTEATSPAFLAAFYQSTCSGYAGDDGRSGGASTTGTVMINRLNVRSGPGVEYTIVGELNAEETITITGYHDTGGYRWWRAHLPSGEIGWVYGDYVDVGQCTDCVPEATAP